MGKRTVERFGRGKRLTASFSAPSVAVLAATRSPSAAGRRSDSTVNARWLSSMPRCANRGCHELARPCPSPNSSPGGASPAPAPREKAPIPGARRRSGKMIFSVEVDYWAIDGMIDEGFLPPWDASDRRKVAEHCSAGASGATSRSDPQRRLAVVACSPGLIPTCARAGAASFQEPFASGHPRRAPRNAGRCTTAQAQRRPSSAITAAWPGPRPRF